MNRAPTSVIPAEAGIYPLTGKPAHYSTLLNDNIIYRVGNTHIFLYFIFSIFFNAVGAHNKLCPPSVLLLFLSYGHDASCPYKLLIIYYLLLHSIRSALPALRYYTRYSFSFKEYLCQFPPFFIYHFKLAYCFF